MVQNQEHQNIVIPVFVVNLEERKDRLTHIKQQFEGKPEFELNIISTTRHANGAIGLWQNIKRIAELAIENEDDIIILCEDDHEFTKYYIKEYLINNIIEAYRQGCYILLGGIGGFDQVIPLSQNRLWVDSFSCTQFVVIYRPFFEKILYEPFDEIDTADGKLSEMTSRKMVLHPFISIQKDFGYSDITQSNNKIEGYMRKRFLNTERLISSIKKANDKYKEITSENN